MAGRREDDLRYTTAPERRAEHTLVRLRDGSAQENRRASAGQATRARGARMPLH